MPGYELILITRPFAKAELIPVLKRTGECILAKGGIIRKIESLGTEKLPYKITNHNETFSRGGRFIVHFESSPLVKASLVEECMRDLDILRTRAYLKNPPPSILCTLEDELKPPAQRPSVAAIFKEPESRRVKLPKPKRPKLQK